MPDIFVNNQRNTIENPSIKLSSSRFPSGIPFTAFTFYVENPTNLTFEDQFPGEKVILFMRRHFITNVPWIVFTFVLLFLPYVLNVALQLINFSFDFLPSRFLTLVIIFYYLIILGYAFSNFTSWFYNIGIITQKRIVDIDFMNLSSINVAVTVISEVEDATFQQRGIFASLFDYGTVHARTLAGKDDFIYDNIPHPARVSNILSGLIGDK
jgi:hypothetical protein